MSRVNRETIGGTRGNFFLISVAGEGGGGIFSTNAAKSSIAATVFLFDIRLTVFSVCISVHVTIQ